MKNVFDIDGLYQNDVIGELFYIGKLAGTSFESNNHHLLLFYQPKFNFADPDNFSLYLFNTYVFIIFIILYYSHFLKRPLITLKYRSTNIITCCIVLSHCFDC